jgi:hypothetical protein
MWPFGCISGSEWDEKNEEKKVWKTILLKPDLEKCEIKA